MNSEDMNCAGKDPRLWDAETEYAYHQCMGCPSKDTCLTEAVADPDASGMRGGMTESQRGYLRRGKNPPLREWQKPRTNNQTRNYLLPSEHAQRRDLANRGFDNHQIAAICGVTAESIRVWRSRHEPETIPYRPTYDPALQAQMRELWEQCMSDREIAEHIGGTTSSSVRRWRVRFGLESNTIRKRNATFGARLEEAS